MHRLWSDARRRADGRVLCRGGVARPISRCGSIPRVCWVRPPAAVAWRPPGKTSRQDRNERPYRMRGRTCFDVKGALGHGGDRARRASEVRPRSAAQIAREARRGRNCGAVNVHDARRAQPRAPARTRPRSCEQFSRVRDPSDERSPKLTAMM